MAQTKQNLIQLFENAPKKDIDGLDFIIDLVNIYRKQKNSVLVDIHDLLDLLQTNADYRNILLHKIESLNISKKDFDQIISDVGIINYSDFLYELRLRLVARLIPHQAPLDSLEFILNQIFYDRKDSEWIASIPDEQLIRLFTLLEGKNIYAENADKHAVSEILYGLEVLTQRVSGRAMEADVSKMTPEYRNFDNPFIGLLQEMNSIIQYVRSQKSPHLESSDIYYKQINILLNQCDKYIDDAFANSHKLGISMKVNQSLLRLRHQLGRIREILTYLVLDDRSLYIYRGSGDCGIV